MITIEQLEAALNDDNIQPFKTNIDHKVVAISLLRERIPYEECKRIIGGAEHDTIYLCDIEQVLPHLTEGDLGVLAECNVFLDSECDCLAIFC